MIRRASLPIVLTLVAGCYSSHTVGVSDAGPTADVAVVDAGDVPECDLRAIECTALPGCHGDRPPETLYCDDVRICLFSDPGDEMATAIAEVSDRIQCTRADSCDFLCGLVDGVFDDEVRGELCEIIRVAPSAIIECAIYGP